jgi:hypothetical protein
MRIGRAFKANEMEKTKAGRKFREGKEHSDGVLKNLQNLQV